jgi:hypothetical protein
MCDCEKCGQRFLSTHLIVIDGKLTCTMCAMSKIAALEYEIEHIQIQLDTIREIGIM